ASTTVVNALPAIANNRTTFTVLLPRSPHFKSKTQAQIAKLNDRYLRLDVLTTRQTIGLATFKSAQFKSSPDDGLFGLGFIAIESVLSVRTFLDDTIAADLLGQPVVSVFLPSEQLRKEYWQVAIEEALYNGQSLGQGTEGIIGTDAILAVVDDAVAQVVHEGVDGAVKMLSMGGGTFHVRLVDLGIPGGRDDL
ncbi:hypothetical protein BGZ97_008197, partial [Linnemannia gamsii]